MNTEITTASLAAPASRPRLDAPNGGAGAPAARGAAEVTDSALLRALRGAEQVQPSIRGSRPGEGFWARQLRQLDVWARRVHERSELAAMGDRELRDIGITRAEVHQEIGKPFWRG